MDPNQCRLDALVLQAFLVDFVGFRVIASPLLEIGVGQMNERIVFHVGAKRSLVNGCRSLLTLGDKIRGVVEFALLVEETARLVPRVTVVGQAQKQLIE